jgi:hypothetical protein
MLELKAIPPDEREELSVDLQLRLSPRAGLLDVGTPSAQLFPSYVDRLRFVIGHIVHLATESIKR